MIVHLLSQIKKLKSVRTVIYSKKPASLLFNSPNDLASASLSFISSLLVPTYFNCVHFLSIKRHLLPSIMLIFMRKFGLQPAVLLTTFFRNSEAADSSAWLYNCPASLTAKDVTFKNTSGLLTSQMEETLYWKFWSNTMNNCSHSSQTFTSLAFLFFFRVLISIPNFRRLALYTQQHAKMPSPYPEENPDPIFFHYG